MQNNAPLVSIIVPTHNSREYLSQSLPAVRSSEGVFFELIIVDDASSDSSSELIRQYADSVITLERNSGPAKARNIGVAQSNGEILIFMDADVKVAVDSVAKVAAYMRENPDIGAIFGSYDDKPAALNFFSQFKNLFHHYVHQHANAKATTFWSGFGAIRKAIFIKAGGFPQGYTTGSIEDVDFGQRIIASGCRINLVKDIQVTHLKKWTFMSLVKTDILARAIPWTRLAFKRGGLPRDLNFKISDRVSGILSFCLFSLFIPMWFFNFLIPFFVICAGILVYLNRELYQFFYDKRGFAFALGGTLFHWFYLFYSLLAYGIVSIVLCLGLMRGNTKK